MGNWCTCSDQRIAADRDRNALSHDAGNADVGNAYGRDAWASGGMPMMGMMQMMAGHVEGRIAFLKTELKITDAQMPVWNAVADAIRAAPKDVSGMPCMPMMQSSDTLPERLAAREKAMTAHLEALRKLRSAVEPLYVALSDDQKKTADQLMIGPIGMGMM